MPLEATERAGSRDADRQVCLCGDDYVLGELLGSGAWGAVHRSVDPSGRPVAVKRSHRPLDDREARRLVERMDALIRLGPHPNVVAVRAVGLDLDGHGIIVTDLVEGTTLWDRPGRSGRPLAVVERWAREVGDALDHLHLAGLVHGDVKPTNVLTRADGSSVLVDFDTLRPAEGVDTVTQIRVSYLFGAPEVLDGAAPTSASDTYQYGASVVALATGSPPFYRAGDSLARFVHRVWHEDLDPGTLAWLPDGLRRSLLACLAREPRARSRHLVVDRAEPARRVRRGAMVGMLAIGMAALLAGSPTLRGRPGSTRPAGSVAGTAAGQALAEAPTVIPTSPQPLSPPAVDPAVAAACAARNHAWELVSLLNPTLPIGLPDYSKVDLVSLTSRLDDLFRAEQLIPELHDDATLLLYTLNSPARNETLQAYAELRSDDPLQTRVQPLADAIRFWEARCPD